MALWDRFRLDTALKQLQSHAILGLEIMLLPDDGPALNSIVFDFLGPRERRNGGHVDDLVLEDDHHEAFVCP